MAKKMYRELGSAVNARSLAPEALGLLTRAVEERRELEFELTEIDIRGGSFGRAGGEEFDEGFGAPPFSNF